MRVRAFAVRLLLGAGVVVSSGCASVRNQQAAVEQMYEYAYPHPLDEIWPEVRKFVAEEGFPPMESPGQYVVVSDWKTSFGENRIASAAERIYVRGIPLNRANSEVRIYRQTRMMGNKGQPSYRERNNGSSLMLLTADEVSPLDSASGSGGTGTPRAQNRVFTRAVDLEWKLLRRLDAEEARLIEERVARGEQAPALSAPAP